MPNPKYKTKFDWKQHNLYGICYLICLAIRFCLVGLNGVEASAGPESVRSDSGSSKLFLPATNFLMDLFCIFGLFTFFVRLPIDFRGVFNLDAALTSLSKAFVLALAGLAFGWAFLGFLGVVWSDSPAANSGFILPPTAAIFAVDFFFAGCKG